VWLGSLSQGHRASVQAQEADTGTGTGGRVGRFARPHPSLQPYVFTEDPKNLSHVL
jgi:hypothetical protein